MQDDCVKSKGVVDMSNLGKYQEIVEDAFRAGGPDIWINTIKKSAYNKGASDMKGILVLPLLAVGVTVGVAGMVAYQKISQWIADKKADNTLTDQEAREAEVFLKQELSDAIDELQTGGK